MRGRRPGEKRYRTRKIQRGKKDRAQRPRPRPRPRGIYAIGVEKMGRKLREEYKKMVLTT